MLSAGLCAVTSAAVPTLPAVAQPGIDFAPDTGLKAASVVTVPPRPQALAPDPPATGGGRLEFIALPALFFDYDRVELSPRTQRLLDEAARFVNTTPGIQRVLISGHADYIDDVPYNYRLSDQRAEAVRYYLMARGVDTQLLYIAGFGELQPTDENWTRYGRHRNRRVELYVVRYAD